VGRSDLAREERELEVEAVEWRKGSFNKFHTFPSDCDSDSCLSSPIAMPSDSTPKPKAFTKQSPPSSATTYSKRRR